MQRGAKRARRDLARIKQDNPDLVANGAMARPRKKQKAKRQTDKQSKAEAPSAAAGSGASTAATSAVAVNKSTADLSGVVDELVEAKRVVSQQAEQLEVGPGLPARAAVVACPHVVGVVCYVPATATSPSGSV